MTIPVATLYALVRAYVDARDTKSHIALFASTKALPNPVKEIIETFVHRYYMEGLRFSHDGKELTPDDITVDNGSLLATYIHSLGSYTVMLASMCQQILGDEYLKKDFVAELPPGVARIVGKSLVGSEMRHQEGGQHLCYGPCYPSPS